MYLWYIVYNVYYVYHVCIINMLYVHVCAWCSAGTWNHPTRRPRQCGYSCLLKNVGQTRHRSHVMAHHPNPKKIAVLGAMEEAKGLGKLDQRWYLENQLLLISINFTPKTQPQLPKKNGTFLCFPGTSRQTQKLFITICIGHAPQRRCKAGEESALCVTAASFFTTWIITFKELRVFRKTSTVTTHATRWQAKGSLVALRYQNLHILKKRRWSWTHKCDITSFQPTHSHQSLILAIVSTILSFASVILMHVWRVSHCYFKGICIMIYGSLYQLPLYKSHSQPVWKLHSPPGHTHSMSSTTKS